MNERNETTVSASREKKVRQELSGQELSEKQIKAQQEAAQAKRNTVIYTVIGVVCAVAAAALLIWNSGIFQNRAAAVTIGGENYSVGDVQYYYNQVLNQYYMYSQYGLDTGFDYTVAPAEQMYDAENNVTWHDQIINEAITAMTETKALVAQAEAEGVKLSEEGEHEVEHAMQDLVATSARNGFSTVNSYLKAAFGSAMSKGKYERAMKESQLAYEYQMAYAEGLTYTDEELETYYAENKDTMDLFDYNYAFFEAAVSEGEAEGGNEAAMQDAQKKAEALKAELADKDFAAAVAQYAEDESVTVKEDRGVSGVYLDSAYAQWLQEDSRKAGDMTVVVDSGETGYFVVEYLGRARTEEISGDVRHILVAAEQDEGATVPTEEQYEAAKAKAEALLEQWKSGAATEESFAELAKKESADPGSAEEGGLYEQVSSASGFIADFANWATDPERKAGDTGLVKNTGSSTKGWHIMYFVGQNDALWQIEAESALANEEGTKWLEGLVEAADVTRLDGLKNVG